MVLPPSPMVFLKFYTQHNKRVVMAWSHKTWHTIASMILMPKIWYVPLPIMSSVIAHILETVHGRAGVSPPSYSICLVPYDDAIHHLRFGQIYLSNLRPQCETENSSVMKNTWTWSNGRWGIKAWFTTAPTPRVWQNESVYCTAQYPL